MAAASPTAISPRARTKSPLPATSSTPASATSPSRGMVDPRASGLMRVPTTIATAVTRTDDEARDATSAHSASPSAARSSSTNHAPNEIPAIAARRSASPRIPPDSVAPLAPMAAMAAKPTPTSCRPVTLAPSNAPTTSGMTTDPTPERAVTIPMLPIDRPRYSAARPSPPANPAVAPIHSAPTCGAGAPLISRTARMPTSPTTCAPAATASAGKLRDAVPPVKSPAPNASAEPMPKTMPSSTGLLSWRRPRGADRAGA